MKAAKRKRTPRMPAFTAPPPTGAALRAWYKGPLTKTRLSELRYKLATARGLLISFIRWEEDSLSSPELLPTTEEVKLILKQTEDP